MAEIALAVIAITELALALAVFTAECAVLAGFSLTAAEMVGRAFRSDGATFIVRDAIAIAAAPPLDAFVGADTQFAIRAPRAIVIVTALLASTAFARCATEQILAAIALGIGTVRDSAGVAGFTAAGADRDAVAAATFFCVSIACVDAAACGACVARFRAGMVGVAARVVIARATLAVSANAFRAVIVRATFLADAVGASAAAGLPLRTRRIG